MSEAVKTRPERPVEERLARSVTRMIDRRQHIPGGDVANFRGDAETMIETGHLYGLEDVELRHLKYILKHSVEAASNREGAIVSMSGRQWGRFVGIRRRYMAGRLDIAQLHNALRSKYRVKSLHNTEK